MAACSANVGTTQGTVKGTNKNAVPNAVNGVLEGGCVPTSGTVKNEVGTAFHETVCPAFLDHENWVLSWYDLVPVVSCVWLSFGVLGGVFPYE